MIAFEIIKKIFIEFFKGTRYVILDVPLLFEAKMMLKLVSFKLVVYCDDDNTRIQRLLSRNPDLTHEDARLRIQSQMSTKNQVEMADYLIDNSSDIENTKKQVKILVQMFSRSKRYLYIRIGLLLISGAFLTSVYLISKLIK